MFAGSLLLLTYYYNYDDRKTPILKYVARSYLGAYQAFDRHFCQPLQRIFENVTVYDYLKRRTEIGATAMNIEILDIVRATRPKYVVWTSFYHDVSPGTLDAIRAEGCVVIGWFFDDEWRFDDYSSWWASHLDYVVTNARDAVRRYQALNVKCILAVPVMGSIERKSEAGVEVHEEHDVTFVGARHYADREQWVDALKAEGVKVDTFGDGWACYLDFDQMLDTFAYSKINLNFARCNDVARTLQIKARVFEVCLSGGFLLTEYAPGLEEFFEIGKEVVCFRDKEEMVAKAKHFLVCEEERRRIAVAGYNRAREHYSCDAVMARIFGQVERDRAIPGNNRPTRSSRGRARRWLRMASDYHCAWGEGAMKEEAWAFFTECARYAIWWDPFNVRAWLQIVRMADQRSGGWLRWLWSRLRGTRNVLS